jgi:hypothetical protein
VGNARAFGQISQWAVPITGSCLDGTPAVGATRICQFAGFGPFKARHDKGAAGRIRFGSDVTCYASAEGMPSFVTSAINRWTVHRRTDARCLVRTHGTLALRGPLRLVQFVLERRLQADGARVLDELRYQVEHRRPHPRQLAAA